ncbi:hypothetical protein [Holophaga foetida]|uniref:hypothetical protein n=1 Tax=Holophaga foetida TaxID=35839 RepID=UPI0002F3DB05|nr:hypothetical protein [Holophaga foetida]
MIPELQLGTVEWEGRCLMVAPLPSDPGRVVDLHRVERVRLAKLGEGHSEILAEATVPPRIRAVLEAGPRALQRVRQALAYAEKWERRSGLPEDLALPLEGLRFCPCLPEPSAIRRADGRALDRVSVRGPLAALSQLPLPTLAVIGMHGGRSAGFCLALEEPEGVVLGGWLTFRWPEGHLEISGAGHSRSIPVEAWEGLSLPLLQPGEVRLLPPPRLRPIPGLGAGSWVEVKAPFEVLRLQLGGDISHPTVQ